MKGNSGLSPRQAAFLKSYSAGMSAAEAGKLAGYSTNYSTQLASRLGNGKLKKMSGVVKQTMKEAKITPEWVVKMLKEQAEYPHGGDPRHRMANIRSLELLGKASGIFKENAVQQTSVTNQWLVLAQDAWKYVDENPHVFPIRPPALPEAAGSTVTQDERD